MYSKVILVGNVVAEPILRKTTNGLSVTTVRMAVDNPAVFIDVEFFDRNADVSCEYFKKGTPILIEGRLGLDEWEDSKGKRSKIYIKGDRFRFLNSGKKKEQEQESDKEDASF